MMPYLSWQQVSTFDGKRVALKAVQEGPAMARARPFQYSWANLQAVREKQICKKNFKASINVLRKEEIVPVASHDGL